jgi:hypothetical protein
MAKPTIPPLTAAAFQYLFSEGTEVGFSSVSDELI